MNEILVLAGAEQDLFGHYCRLEERREGAGDKFDQAIHERLELQRQNPFMAPAYLDLTTIRRLAILEWDVGLYYSVEGTRNVVHAVLHLRQDKETIRATLLARLPQ
jgi:hypothetical protein